MHFEDGSGRRLAFEALNAAGALAPILRAAKGLLRGGDFVYVTLINKAYARLTANWLCNVAVSCPLPLLVDWS